MSRALIFCCLVAACSDGVSSFTMPGEEPLDMTPLRAPCGVDEDLDGDGSLDTFSRFFDEDGGRTWRVEQRDAERTLLHDEVWRFDAGGRLIELSWRVDGELTQHRTFVYDDFGRGLRWERDDDGDGLYEEIEVATAWDEEGGVESTSVERAGDAALASEATHDELGRLTSRVYRADGVEVRRTEVSYDDVARTRTTTVIDGTLRFTEVRSYDAHGRLTRVAIEPLDAGSHQPPVLEELHYDGDRLVEIVDQSEGWTRRARYRYCD